MYYLMNKDRVVAEIKEAEKSVLTNKVLFAVSDVYGELPFGFNEINEWIDGRKSSKHSHHLQSIMQSLGCEDNEGFIRITHAATINDTFWVKSDAENVVWKDISLYANQFTEAISRLAFEGVGLCETVFSSTSPELTCDGSFHKCFRKENKLGEFGSDIFLYKRCGDIGAGLEPYCEQMASEIARVISPDNSVSYELTKLHGKISSKCNLFTNEQYGYASYAKAAEIRSLDLDNAFKFFEKLGSEQAFREMLVIDALCFNQDRHAGNFGVLFDNESLKPVCMSPVFDLNIALFPYVSEAEFANIGDKLFDYAPKLGDDFTRIGQIGLNEVIRERVKDMRDFSFTFRGDSTFPKSRVESIETIVQKQAEAILSSDKLFTKDVFFSARAQEAEVKAANAEKATALLRGFEDIVEKTDLSSGTFFSSCSSSDTVQLYLEKDNLMFTVDFLNGTTSISDNTVSVSTSFLRDADKAFAMDCDTVKAALKQYVREQGDNTFRCFQSSKTER